MPSIKNTIAIVLMLASIELYCQSIDRIQPANWWVGMKYNTITLLIHGDNIQKLVPAIDYNGVTLDKTTIVENPNYLFLTLTISKNAQPGNVNLVFLLNGKPSITKVFPLLKRNQGSDQRQGFTAKDAVMLIVPDRFANGDTTNDNTLDTTEKVNRKNDDGRHGGDIKGIIDHLDYIQSLGFTQIWHTPLIENNMPKYSYHGYAATDFYKIDSRFGTNEQFRQLVKEAKKRGIGIIWDVVVNHCGLEYYFIKDMPSKDWVNFHGTHARTNHLKSTLLDPYAPVQDRTDYTDGWFDNHMPDLNQRNPLLASYLIQNTIWWIEYADLSGLREDTYSYADKDFLATWSKAVTDEYPHINIVGEEMTTTVALSAYWQKDKVNADGYISYLPSLMDFLLTDNTVKSLNSSNNWFSTWRDTYQGISQDYNYAHPENLLIFPDNHDLDRIYNRLNKDLAHWKIAMALYATMRGIPQFFYGTEVLMTHEKSGHDGQRRNDFMGGWPEDKVNAFNSEGLNDDQKDAKEYFTQLLNWRKTATAIHNGKLRHYAPSKNDAYVYFRYNENSKIMVILNKNNAAITLDLDTYKDMIPMPCKAKDALLGRIYNLEKTLEVQPKSALILQLIQ
jgi:neopullulanase